MKFTSGTAKLNSILAKVGKGVGSNKILPITEYLKVELAASMLTITATNSINFIKYTEVGVEGEPGTVIVKADQLIKLAAKTTKPNLSFTATETHLEVKGNGVYKIPLFETNEYPEYEFDEEATSAQVKTSDLKKMLSTNKASIATEMLMPCLTGYKVGQQCITTDGVKMCINETFIPAGHDMLIPQGLADLLTVLSGDTVNIQKDGNKLRFTDENVVIVGPELSGIEVYPDITGILEYKYTSYAVVHKQALLEALDRLSLFVDTFDNNGVRMMFLPNCIEITDLKKNSSEELEYVEKSLPYKGDDSTEKVLESVVNIEFLKDLLAVISGDKVHIEFGEGLPVKLIDGPVTQILSVLNVG